MILSMKKVFLLMVSFIGVFLFVSDMPPVGRWTYTPVFMSRDVLENSVKYISGEREMVQTGKIYYRTPYIYINERYKGVHIINNVDPAHPVKEGFILAPGCIDIAVKGNILYLDNAVDLVSFDLDSKQVTKRIRNVFPEPLSPDGSNFYSYNRPDGYVLVEWKKVYHS
jgi:hypothetical protein